MYLHKHSINVTATTTGSVSFHSTILTGTLYSVRLVKSTALGLSTARTVVLSRESTDDQIFKMQWPSSSVNRYPRLPVHGSTGAALKSTDFITPFPLCKERIKVNIDQSTASAKISGSLVVYIAGN